MVIYDVKYQGHARLKFYVGCIRALLICDDVSFIRVGSQDPQMHAQMHAQMRYYEVLGGLWVYTWFIRFWC